jgi:hypothetical protein
LHSNKPYDGIQASRVGVRTRLNLIAFVISLVGLGSAVIIYLTFENPPERIFSAYEQSKMFRHEMEAAGGKLNMLTSDFMIWFDGLWHGKPLAFTIGWITVIISIMILYIAQNVSSEPRSDYKGKNAPEK